MKLYDKHFLFMDGKSGYKYIEFGATRLSNFQNSFLGILYIIKIHWLAKFFVLFVSFLFFDAEQKLSITFSLELLKKRKFSISPKKNGRKTAS